MILVPTRERPKNAKRLWDSLVETTWNAEVRFCMDWDDPKHLEYERLLPAEVLLPGPSQRLGPWLNYASTMFRGDYDIIGFLGDDVVSKTYGWDDIVRGRLTKNAIIYPNDGWQGAGLPTSVFMDSGLIERLGYMVHPSFTHLYIDNHWKELGLALDSLKYLEQIDMEHLHPFAGKAETDRVYEEANHPNMYSKDRFAFEYWKQHVLPEDVARAKA
jgi:hypothetical protein